MHEFNWLTTIQVISDQRERLIRSERQLEPASRAEPSLVVGWAFVEGVAGFGWFGGLLHAAFELFDLGANDLEVGLDGKQHGMHLLQFVFEMSDCHFEIDDALIGFGHGHRYAFLGE